jgi:hypothetical protein
LGQNLFNNLRKHQPFNHKQHYIFQKPAWVASSFLNLLEVERKPKKVQGDTCALFLLCSQLSGDLGARFVASSRFLFSKAKWLDSKSLSPPRRRQTLTLGFYFHHKLFIHIPKLKIQDHFKYMSFKSFPIVYIFLIWTSFTPYIFLSNIQELALGGELFHGAI